MITKVVKDKNISLPIPLTSWEHLRQTHLGSQDLLPEHAWRVLMRYRTWIGEDRSGGGLQGALTSASFSCLSREFDVDFECFASPFNNHFNHYCSAFPDTDCAFGSVGSFFEFTPAQGSFEANPPFSEELMIKMIAHLETLISSTSLPLSFAVIVPYWTDSQAIQRLEQIANAKIILEPQQHFFTSGIAHMDTAQSESNRLSGEYPAVHATLVAFVQNVSGSEKWPASPEKLDRLRSAFSARSPRPRPPSFSSSGSSSPPARRPYEDRDDRPRPNHRQHSYHGARSSFHRDH
jgi:hypothetical protein